MNKLHAILSRYGDKFMHASITFAVVLAGGLFGLWWVGLIVAVALSICKEALDQWVYKGWSWGDLLADLAGIVAAIVLVLIAG